MSTVLQLSTYTKIRVTSFSALDSFFWSLDLEGDLEEVRAVLAVAFP
jgi:hypothetical protein